MNMGLLLLLVFPVGVHALHLFEEPPQDMEEPVNVERTLTLFRLLY